ncbi:Ltp family lipoprotein [Ruminococcus flavefaciens]|uniref:Ltp family lipoprotein n=1 Tax=Ruminococcus flavefaciens TaxID=1265 RepID=UPI0013DA2CA6|nr:Ltp family lipoprotein [Ruminococcus flavefaciens]
MKKMLSVIVGISMLLWLSACSEATKETSSEERAETTTAITSHTVATTETAVQEPSTVEPVTYSVTSDQLDKSFEVPMYRDPVLTIKLSSEWKGDRYYNYSRAISDGIVIRFDDKRTDDYTDNDDFLDKFLEKSPDWTIYENKNHIKFATITEPVTGPREKEHSIYKVFNNGCVVTIYFGTMSADGYRTLSRDSIDNILNTVSLVGSNKTTEKATDKPTEPPTTKPNVSKGQENALKQAKSYISHSAFSYNELIEQLEYEKYSHDEAVYGADNCGADWNAEALEQAKSYINMSGFSYTGLIEQLEYEQFTSDQARYGADNCGADWNQQAADSAASYLKTFDFSRDELIEQLLYEGFTQEQAEYGASANGY